MSTGSAVVCLVVGPDEHGVVVEALRQHAALSRVGAGAGVDARLVRLAERPTADALLAAVREAPPGPVLVHVTDKLFGRSALEAADVLEALAAQRRLVVALHDLPQASDGATNHARRTTGYVRVARAAAAVLVASRHEARLLAACGVSAEEVPVAVVPLPVPVLPAGPRAVRPAEAVAVLGYLYPGKGHDDVVAALDALPPGVGLLAWGTPSSGHDDLVDALAAQAAALGRTVEVTGWVPDEALPALLRSAVVPVAPHAHLSASGSINLWVAAGRRPLVPRSDYAEELLERSPGCVVVYDDLPAALAAAWADPASTWAPEGSRPSPTADDAAALVRRVLDRLETAA
ncbi:glycosyltransferase [Quadrisphaera sp. INWT6]|uniref:glycosyltransferase n=1 Tax=Quadrisphaera sp. INWT6 TaxID=2596917 RepID=UPI0018923505|nr:glycosyltransferase [Quadrisphaera sp. INWT6]MBF5082530.1 glycosyltransferase [Quadrisphaera sp. INWT6]